MIVATLQFSPELGEVAANIIRADALLSASPTRNIDLLVLPELAFSGYNHTRDSIKPLLEPSLAGPSSAWARRTAAKYDCIVSVGYPEVIDSQPTDGGTGQNGIVSETKVVAYNSTITVNPQGDVLAHYRKTHLYYTDEAWAQEGPAKWLVKDLALPVPHKDAGSMKAAFGICMDLNPHRFTAPWDVYEFATFASDAGADALLLSMAWLTSLPAAEVRSLASEPDMDTLAYWIGRLSPLLNGKKEVLVVCANRCGEEGGPNPCGQMEEGVRYAGTSWVGKIGKGSVSVWGMLGRGHEALLVVDTDDEPAATFSLASKADVEAQKRAEEMKVPGEP